MRPVIQIAVEPDPNHKDKLQIALYVEGLHQETLCAGLTAQEASRMHVPLRRAFLAGMHWMREDVSSYTLSLHPDVICLQRGAT